MIHSYLPVLYCFSITSLGAPVLEVLANEEGIGEHDCAVDDGDGAEGQAHVAAVVETLKRIRENNLKFNNNFLAIFCVIP